MGEELVLVDLKLSMKINSLAWLGTAGQSVAGHGKAWHGEENFKKNIMKINKSDPGEARLGAARRSWVRWGVTGRGELKLIKGESMKKSKNIYTVSDNERKISQKKAQKYGEYLERLAQLKEGKLTPHVVINVARSKDSPIHDYFEWDDSKAAYEFRIEQARHLLRNIKIVITYKDEEKIERMFFNVMIAKGKQAYVQTEIVIKNEDYKQQIIQKALDELISWQEKYKEYKELDRIFGIIEEVQKKLKT